MQKEMPGGQSRWYVVNQRKSYKLNQEGNRELGFPCSSDSRESSCSGGDLGSVLGSGRSPGEGNGNPLQYSCLKNPMGRGAWQAIVHGVKTRD